MALVLTRTDGESVIVTLPSGEIIKITTMRYNSNQIRISFDCSKDIKIMREELLEVKK